MRNCNWRELQRRDDPRVELLFKKDGWMKSHQCTKWIQQFHDLRK